MEALATHSKLSAWLAVWTAPLQVEGKEVDCLELPLNLNCDLVMLGVTGKPWGFKNGEPHGLPTV